MILTSRRPTIVSTVHAGLLALAFPNAGTINSTTNLGIVWNNPADHTEALSPVNGFDFNSGFGYTALNLMSVAAQTLYPNIAMQFYIVDGSGADLYLCGSTTFNVNAGVSVLNVLSFSVAPHSAPGNGIRGQITITNSGGSSGTVLVPSPLLFFGSM